MLLENGSRVRDRLCQNFASIRQYCPNGKAVLLGMIGSMSIESFETLLEPFGLLLQLDVIAFQPGHFVQRRREPRLEPFRFFESSGQAPLEMLPILG